MLSAAIRTLRRLPQMPAAERAAALALVPLLAVTGQILRRRGLGAAERALKRLPAGALRPLRALPPARVAQLVAALGARVPGATCLVRALVLALGSAAPGAVVCIGVAKGAPGLDAHAWVELDGMVLNDSKDVRTRYCVIETRVL